MASNRRHLKRNSMPSSWPVQRKVFKFISKPQPGSHAREYSISVLLLLRDVLGYAQNSKEAKFIVNNQEFLVNGKQVKEIKFPVGLFDVIEIPVNKEKFVVLFNEVGRVKLVKADGSSVYLKVAGKKQVKGGSYQLNFMNGYNLIVDEKQAKSINVEDTVEFDYSKKKIAKVHALKDGADVYVFDGKFKGQLAKVKSITKHNGITRDLVELEIGKEIATTAKDYAYVISKEDVKRFA